MDKNILGFSIIEVMVTLLVIAIGLLALTSFQGQLMKDNTLSNQRSEALVIAQQKIEELRVFEKMLSEVGVVAYQDIASGNDLIDRVNTSYTRTWTVQEYTGLNYKTVTLVITWAAVDGSNQSVSLTSMINQASPYDSGRLMMPIETL